jgi:hypothetical protein
MKKKNNSQQKFRQGDVLLLAIAKAPAKTQPVPLELGRVILAHGEVTGHHHSFAADSGVALLEGDGGERFLRVEHESRLEHQEHDTLLIPPGEYIVRRQKEYSPEAIRSVAD